MDEVYDVFLPNCWYHLTAGFILLAAETPCYSNSLISSWNINHTLTLVFITKASILLFNTFFQKYYAKICCVMDSYMYNVFSAVSRCFDLSTPLARLMCLKLKLKEHDCQSKVRICHFIECSWCLGFISQQFHKLPCWNVRAGDKSVLIIAYLEQWNRKPSEYNSFLFDIFDSIFD